MRATTPTGVARTFGEDEIIVSKTDLRGRITYANDVFLRVSAYAEDEVLGQPHSLIRHPETPRGLFHLLWESIQGGDEIFAYINNLAKDGAHYWVLAHVTPTRDTRGTVVGYHSSRRSPAPAAVARVEHLYARMRAAEAGHRRAVDAAAASRAALEELLGGRPYDELVWELVAEGEA
ncbi:PAS domain S-box-containing protein [Georgenia satyanarayanai]|uniref:PAS domain S-box-containing protein n=1 Tax=Georgenia satyanarayanai TaxID=860221 RepID=A0A2Y9BWP0_9MICO|nr:PAS domain-containing protein [Georgenia satyanarayanai]PYG01163.1 PAS domain S-box-containing protein [Georgenia satyanarayanai]SSA39402.1 PAS domain S-box-containing protein [Georgenia satyanarayanai]